MLKILPPSEAKLLRAFFAEANYTDVEFHNRPMLRELPSRRSGTLPYLLDCTREPSPFNLLIRLFLLGLPTESRSATDAIPEGVLSLMLKCGMLEARGDTLQPTVMVTPLDQFLIAADSSNRMEAGDTSELVLWPNPTTRLLQLFTVRRPSDATLDLGAGCGILSLLAAEHSRKVVATDLNARAAEFTQFNAHWNGIENVESRTGDTFETVKDQTFDLIVANPPFFVSPSSDRLFCENPMELDGYCRRVVREGANRLNEGGFLQMVFEWVQVQGQTWQQRLQEWVENIGCDVWILRSYMGAPESYAQQRTIDDYANSPESGSAKFANWVNYYRTNGVEQVLGGVLAMRRRTGRNWVRFENLPLNAGEPFGQSILEIFATQDALASHPSDEQLQNLKPRLPDKARLEQCLQQSKRLWAPEVSRIFLTGALPASLNVEFPVAQFLARCDGQRSLGELITELAGLVKADVSQVSQQCCSIVRKFAEHRLLCL